MSNINLIYCIIAIATITFVAGGGVTIVRIPVKRRGLNLDGSVFIANNQGQLIEYDVIFSITSTDFWVFGKNLRGDLLDSPKFAHQFYEPKGGRFKKNGAGLRFESVAYDGNGKADSLVSGRIGLQGFETITFQNNNRGTYFERTPIGIVDNVMTASSISSHSSSNEEGGVYFDYDGTFGLWPQKSYGRWPFNSQNSYLDQLPKNTFSLYLSGSGESGELMLGGYDKSKINGDIGCQQISRLSQDPGGAVLQFSTIFYLGKMQLTMDKKQRQSIRTAWIDPELVGILAPPLTVLSIAQKCGAKYMSVLPSINEEDEQHSNQEDEGYFISCRRRSAVNLSFHLGGKFWSITGDDLFIPSPVNPSWCRMIVDTTAEHLIILGDIFFRKFVTVFDFEGPDDEPKMCIGTAKHRRGKRDRMKKRALLLSEGGGGSTNNTTTTTMTVF